MLIIYKLLGSITILTIVLSFTYKYGYNEASDDYELARLELIQQHAIDLQVRLDEIRELEEDWLNEEREVEIKTIIRTKKVIEYVEQNGDNECLNDDAIELFNNLSSSNMP